MQERWLTIAEAPRYKISDRGNVRSVADNKVKVAFPDQKGYIRVQLYRHPEKVITRKVHRLVAEYFVSDSGGLPQVNHIDGNKQNNHYTNLEWMTNKQNYDHARSLNLHTHKSEIRLVAGKIKVAVQQGYSISEIAKKLGTTTKTINGHMVDAVSDPDYHELVQGISRKAYYYYDKGRNKYRVESTPNKGIKSKQFTTELEAQQYVVNSLTNTQEKT